VTSIEPFELFAIKYAVHSGRLDCDNFIGATPEPGSDLAYYVWVARRSDSLFLVDTGFQPETAARRGRTLIETPVARLARLGIAPQDCTRVILTHLHYDHAGTLDDFPMARFHIQAREASYATGPHMRDPFLRATFEEKDVVSYVHALFGGRVEFHDGDATLVDGLSVHRIPGHTPGLQAVRVWTRRGWVLLASDATHLYANLDRKLPFPVVYNVGALLDGYRRLDALADSRDHIIPGHDPVVMDLYPSPTPELDGIVACLHLDPVGASTGIRN
jgi:glyoxylase-like metal-dependent hydrolase (beta-lactamase superfamily II)